MRVIRYYLIFIFLNFLLPIVNAQPNCKIEHYSTENGLSHDIITCMFKDREGFMWFGTWDGINRFDGHKFRAFKSSPGDLSQLKNDRIDQITEDDADHLWIKAYDGQIYRFDKKSEQFMPLSAILGLTEKTKINFNKIISCTGHMLWASTVSSGLICVPDTRFRGSKFITYSKGSKAQFHIPSEQINFFQYDRQGQIWLGTPEGLTCLEKDVNGIFHKLYLNTNAFGKLNYTAMAEGADQLFFATAQGTIVVYNKYSHAFSGISTGGKKLNAVILSKHSQLLYLSTGSGEIITVNPLIQHISTSTYQSAIPLISLYEDLSGNIWAEPDGQGIVRYDPVTGSFRAYSQLNDSKSNYAGNHFKVFEDNRGTLWTIMRGGGFGYYDKSTDAIAYFYNRPGSSDRRFSNIVSVGYYDPDDILWLYTDQRGIEKVIFQPNEFTQKLLIDPWMFKSDNEVRGLFCDRKNRIWVGAKSGRLYVYDGASLLKDIFVNQPPDGLGSIYAILQDKKGSLWLGTKANGLFRADPLNADESRYRLTHFRSDPKNRQTLSSNEIYALAEDNEGRIWAGTFDEGLNLAIQTKDNTQFLRFKDQRTIYPARGFTKIRCITKDYAGALWIGTTDGLVVLGTDKQGKFSTVSYNKKPGDAKSLGNNDIQYIYRDSHDRMWLATSGGGLNLAGIDPFSGHLSFKVYTTQNGLPNDYLLSCTEDTSGHIWVATQSGLSRFDPATQHFQNFNSYDGVPNTAFSEASCQRRADGTLIFGMLKGLLFFNPNSIRNYPIYANMALTNLQINNADAKIGVDNLYPRADVDKIQGITLNYQQNIFSIDYTVLDYRSTDKQSYQYRLIGFDPQWHNNDNQRRATYTNLPAGNYVFEVRCVNPELYRNIPSKKLQITIMPPPWRTIWAYLLYCIVAVGIFEIIRRTALTMLRLRQRIAVEHQLTELKIGFFTNISHELRTPLTLIINPLEEIDKQEKLSAQGKQYLDLVRRNANRMTRFVNQLLDMRKVQSGKAKLHLAPVDVVSFVREIGDYFMEVGREKHITLNIEGTPEAIYCWLDVDKIETVLYNIISNAYKFSPENRTINVRIKTDSVAEGELLLSVEDQGAGVSTEELRDIFELYYEGNQARGGHLKGTGIGLALSKQLVELHGGKISAANNTGGKGLTVSVRLPVMKPSPANNEPAIFEGSPLQQVVPEYDFSKALPAAEKLLFSPADAPLVLLVEDNTDMRNFLKEQLALNYRVEVAENGEDGLKKVFGFSPDLILSDIMMPKMNGIELLDKLKNDERTSHIPVILLSAKSAIESQIEGIRYGADYYVTKPFNNDFLLAAIANILRQRKKQTEALMSGKKTISLKPGEITITSKDEIFLKKIVQIVEEKMADADFNIDTVAGTVNMGRTAFFGKFKSLTQMAPVEFVREMRLERAKQYFDGGMSNIAEVAYTVGFNNAKYFSTCFKAKYDLSPSEYLKSKE